MRRPVLIVIDMLNDYLDKWEASRKQELVQSINELILLMRQFGHSIIWVRQEFESDLRDAFPEMKRKGIRITIKETEGCKISSDLAIASSNPMSSSNGTAPFLKQTLTRFSTE